MMTAELAGSPQETVLPDRIGSRNEKAEERHGEAGCPEP